MRITVIGCGGVGGYLAGRAAEAGHLVTVVCRGQTAAALTDYGVRLIDTFGARSARVSVVDTSNAAAVSEEPDLVLLCVKSWQVADLAPRLEALVGRHGLLATMQNGIKATELAAAAIGEHRVLAGALMLVVEQLKPGVYQRCGNLMELTMGSTSPTLTHQNRQVGAVMDALTSTGLQVSWTAEVRRTLWRKLIFASAVGGVPAMSGVPAGDAVMLPHVDTAIRSAISEGVAVARADGIVFTPAEVTQIVRDYEQLPAGMISSMHRDIRAGRRSELVDQNGTIARLGALFNVPTPTHSKVISLFGVDR